MRLESGSELGEKLKYYRQKNKLTQTEIAQIIGFSKGSSITDIELGRKLLGRDASIKLATYFSLDTKYFFDDYLEDTDDFQAIIKKYRHNHNLTIKQVCSKFNISETTWVSWEMGRNYVSREKYKLLKEYKIL